MGQRSGMVLNKETEDNRQMATLYETLEAIDDEELIVSVGAKSGYLIIGKKNEVLEELIYKSQEIEARNTELLLNAQKELKRLTKKIEFFKKAIADYKPLGEREVLDKWDRRNPKDGICIKVKGHESGEHWKVVQATNHDFRRGSNC